MGDNQFVIFTIQENIRNTTIKDIMRDQCVPDLVESWLQIIVRSEVDICWHGLALCCTYVFRLSLSSLISLLFVKPWKLWGHILPG